MTDDIKLEIYKTNYSYLMHTESLRIKQLNLYFTVISAFLGLMVFMFTSSAEIEKAYHFIIATGICFLQQ